MAAGRVNRKRGGWQSRKSGKLGAEGTESSGERLDLATFKIGRVCENSGLWFLLERGNSESLACRPPLPSLPSCSSPSL